MNSVLERCDRNRSDEHLRGLFLSLYVPVRVDTEDRADESLGGPEQAQNEQLPGQDALELITDSRFVAISGRPGSGKTTLVQALIGELTRGTPQCQTTFLACSIIE